MSIVETVEFEISGMRFVADVAGHPDAPAVLLLHGFPQTRHTWRDQLPALAEAGFRAVAPDQRGYSPGARPATIESYATNQLVDDVLAFADALGSPVDLVGHDWGGQLAWLTAAHHPHAVRTLTVLSRPHPAAFARAFVRDTAQADRSKHHQAFHDPATAELLLADDARRLRRMLADQRVPAADIDAYLTVLGDVAAMDAAVNWYRATPPEGLRAADTPTVGARTLYLWGDADHSVGRTAAELTASHVTGPYRLVEIAGGGHFLTDDGNSAEVTAQLLAHIGGHG